MTDTVSGAGIRHLQEVLNKKADGIQRAFIVISDRLAAIARELPRTYDDEHETLLAEQETLRARRQAIAEEVNDWRDWAQALTQQRSEASLQTYLKALLEIGDDALRPEIEQALDLLDAPDQSLTRFAQSIADPRQASAAARLIHRARTEYDLRGDPAARKRAAVEFANRTGMAQDESAIAEIEAAVDDPDPMAREVASLTAIQLHRFRAMRLGDLQAAHESVLRLTRLNHPAVVLVLIEVLEHPRTGYVKGEDANNDHSRRAALTRLVEWHTADAQHAIRHRQFDRDPQIVHVAERALELFPGEWKGPLKGTGID